jgi:hypothetical protein
MWRLDEEDCFPDSDCYDVHLVRSRPMEDDEAELIEAICQAATPGPLATDDVSDGGGALVATLPDGRSIVSVSAVQSCPEDARSRAVADAQMICEARSVLLRLLHDRERWQRREKLLAEKIRSLEDQLERPYETVGQAEWSAEDPAPVHPR